MNGMRSLALLAAVACVPALQAADYTFTPGAESARVTVELKKGERIDEFRMPAWAPGDYQIFNYGGLIDEVIFSRKGKPAVGEKSKDDPNLWKIPDGADSVSYTVKPSRGNFSPNLQIRGELVFVNGAGVFGWFPGHQDKPHTLTLKLGDNQAGYSAMPGTEKVFKAKDYDELLDCPVVMGPRTAIRMAEKNVAGKPHRVLVFGDNALANVDGFLTVGAAAAEQAHKMFGELPYDRYTYFIDMGGPGGGLEHMNSTRIGVGRNTTPQGAVGLMFHEYFHCFNVKRIRSKPLGPFDYTKPAITGALWWLEGVTDYYADLFAVRAGYREPMDGFNDVFRAMQGASRGNNLKVSADEASRRVWETRGSFGFGGVSYYSRGHALGFYLDLALRAATEDKKTLDDVMRRLYKECKDGPGFAEGRIRQILISVGGEQMGAIYDESVMKPTALDPAPFFQTLGIRVNENGQVVNLGRSNWPNATIQ